MLQYFGLVTLHLLILAYAGSENSIDSNVGKREHHVYWPNAVIPFFIDPEHFDHEQSLSIMTSLSLFAFKTCLKFSPVLVRPTSSQHVMLFENPNGVRKCVFNTDGHSTEEPHRIILGYNCLKSPQIDMFVMRALGFSFEHNRASRDLYIDVQFENVDPGAMELFTKETKLPIELRPLRYDVNSVTHFGDRDFSKNGHRTIIFKDHNISQNRNGLSDLDIRKIEIIYGPECQMRDRQEKIDLCQNYPGVARRKRDLELPLTGPSLRVNREITAPPENNVTTDLTNSLDTLGIEIDVKEILDKVYRVSSHALKNARGKYCNETDTNIRSNTKEPSKPSDVLGMAETITNYAKSIVDHAMENLTEFCEASNSVDQYNIARCSGDRCYSSTKSGIVKFYTQHRPSYGYPTRHYSKKHIYANNSIRSRNETEPEVKSRRKRATDVTPKEIIKPTNKTETELNKDNITTIGKTITTQTVLKRTAEVNRTTGDAERYTVTTIDKPINVSKTTRKVEEKVSMAIPRGRRRFQDTPFHIYKRKRSDVDYESDLSLETKQEQITPKHVKPKKKNHPAQKKTSSSWKQMNRGSPVRKIRTQLAPATVQLTPGNRDFYGERKWRNNLVPYVIKDLSKYNLKDVRQRLEQVNKILKSNTCVYLKEITEDEASMYEDYLLLDNSPDYVAGRVGGRQNFGVIELFEGGQHRQHTAMVVMSMLGFYFEPCRYDRDKYIRVHARHIRPDKLHHFEKLRAEASFSLPYDYKSAMHPAWQFWRQLGRTGISTVATYKDQDPDGFIMKSLGQNTKLLSDLDIVKINSVYGVSCFH